MEKSPKNWAHFHPGQNFKVEIDEPFFHEEDPAALTNISARDLNNFNSGSIIAPPTKNIIIPRSGNILAPSSGSILCPSPGSLVTSPPGTISTASGSILRDILTSNTQKDNEINSYPCNFCSKSFSTKFALDNHVKTHMVNWRKNDVCAVW